MVFKKKSKQIAVFCGSSIGKQNHYREAVHELVESFIQSNVSLVYGGAKVGLMGVMADAMLKQGGKVIGVIPELLAGVEVIHQGLTKVFIVQTMHERKKLMSDLADGFIMFPGGAGSLDEFFEVFTWHQLGIHTKPCGILNINHYFDHLIRFLDHSVEEGFLKNKHRERILIDTLPSSLLQKFEFINRHKTTR